MSNNTYYCMDWLGGARYPKVVLDNHPIGWGAGFFINVEGFGSCWDVATKLAQKGICPAFRFHAVWDDNHIYRPATDDILIMQRLARTIRFKEQFPDLDIYFSPFCEHEITGRPLRALFDKVIARARGTGVIIVNNPDHKGGFLDDVLSEVHGYRKKPSKGKHLYSFDGTACVDADVEKIKKDHAGAELFFWWTYQFNLNRNANDKTERKDRKAIPTPKLIDSVIYLKNDRGAVKYGKNQTFKSHADQHDAPIPEPRAFKPVYIIPESVSRLELVADNGQTVAVSYKKERYKDGRWMYRFNEWGMDITEKAKRIQNGKPTLSLLAEKESKFFATVNAAFRGGEYR